MPLAEQVARLLADEAAYPGTHDPWTVRLAKNWQRLTADPEERVTTLETALREIEWCWDGEQDRCPSCGMTERQGHDRSCTISGALSATTKTNEKQ